MNVVYNDRNTIIHDSVVCNGNTITYIFNIANVGGGLKDSEGITIPPDGVGVESTFEFTTDGATLQSVIVNTGTWTDSKWTIPDLRATLQARAEVTLEITDSSKDEYYVKMRSEYSCGDCDTTTNMKIATPLTCHQIDDKFNGRDLDYSKLSNIIPSE